MTQRVGFEDESESGEIDLQDVPVLEISKRPRTVYVLGGDYSVVTDRRYLLSSTQLERIHTILQKKGYPANIRKIPISRYEFTRGEHNLILSLYLENDPDPIHIPINFTPAEHPQEEEDPIESYLSGIAQEERDIILRQRRAIQSLLPEDVFLFKEVHLNSLTNIGTFKDLAAISLDSLDLVRRIIHDWNVVAEGHDYFNDPHQLLAATVIAIQLYRKKISQHPFLIKGKVPKFDIELDSVSPGGNLTNALHTYSTLESALSTTLTPGKTDVHYFFTGPKESEQFLQFPSNFVIHHQEGKGRVSLLLHEDRGKHSTETSVHEDRDLIFSIPKAEPFQTPQPVNLPSHLTDIMLSNEPCPGDYQRVVDYKNNNPDLKVHMLFSSRMAELEKDEERDLKELVKISDFISLNLAEACGFLRIYPPDNRNTTEAERRDIMKRCLWEFHRYGTKSVMITDGERGSDYMYLDEDGRRVFRHQDAVNLPDMKELLASVGTTYLDQDRSIDVRDQTSFDTAGCGDTAFGTLTHLAHNRPEVRRNHQLRFSSFMASLVGIYPNSNPHGIDSEVLRALYTTTVRNAEPVFQTPTRHFLDEPLRPHQKYQEQIVENLEDNGLITTYMNLNGASGCGNSETLAELEKIANTEKLPLFIPLQHTDRVRRDSPHEDREKTFLGPDEFSQMEHEGAFIVIFDAHGHRYGYTPEELLKAPMGSLAALMLPPWAMLRLGEQLQELLKGKRLIEIRRGFIGSYPSKVRLRLQTRAVPKIETENRIKRLRYDDDRKHEFSDFTIKDYSDALHHGVNRVAGILRKKKLELKKSAKKKIPPPIEVT